MNDNLLRINVERDLTEILKLIEGYMQKTYIKDIEHEMHRCKEHCELEPCKEVQFLTALAPLMPVDKQQIFGEITEFLKYEQIANEMMPSLLHTNTRQVQTDEDRFKKFVVKLLLYKILFQKNKNNR